GTLGFLEELRPLWRLLPALPRPRMTVVEVCQQTLFDCLRAAQEKLPNLVDRLEEDHYQEMGSAVVTRGSTTFKVGEKTAVGKALVGLAELMRDSIELPPVCTVLPLLFMRGSAYYLLLLPLSAVLLQSAVATLSGSSRASRVTDYECTAQYKDSNNTYWFSFIKFEGSFLLTTAMKD
ncbi:hypothetical protein FOZ62_013992, partial [Perkinsus olseni]